VNKGATKTKKTTEKQGSIKKGKRTGKGWSSGKTPGGSMGTGSETGSAHGSQCPGKGPQHQVRPSWAGLGYGPFGKVFLVSPSVQTAGNAQQQPLGSKFQ